MVIGFRSFANGFSYVVLDGVQEKPEVVDADRFTCPKGAGWPESLSWVRRQAAELCDRFELTGACIKTIEPIAMKKSKERLQIEAVLIEFTAQPGSSLNSSGILKRSRNPHVIWRAFLKMMNTYNS